MATLFGCNISLTVAADFMAFPKDWQEETTDKKQEEKRDRRFVGAMRRGGATSVFLDAHGGQQLCVELAVGIDVLDEFLRRLPCGGGVGARQGVLHIALLQHFL